MVVMEFPVISDIIDPIMISEKPVLVTFSNGGLSIQPMNYDSYLKPLEILEIKELLGFHIKWNCF